MMMMIMIIVIIIIIITMLWAVLGDNGTMQISISISNEKFCSFSDKNANN